MSKQAVHNNVPPVWSELGVERIMPELVQVETIMCYLPDFVPGKRYVDREFLWKIMFFAKPNLAKDIIADATK